MWSPFRFDKTNHYLDIPNKTVPWLWSLLLKTPAPKKKLWRFPTLAILECGHEKRILQTYNCL